PLALFSRYILSPITLLLFFFTVPASTAIYTLSLHDALPICPRHGSRVPAAPRTAPRRATAASSPTGACRRADRRAGWRPAGGDPCPSTARPPGPPYGRARSDPSSRSRPPPAPRRAPAPRERARSTPPPRRAAPPTAAD